MRIYNWCDPPVSRSKVNLQETPGTCTNKASWARRSDVVLTLSGPDSPDGVITWEERFSKGLTIFNENRSQKSSKCFQRDTVVSSVHSSCWIWKGSIQTTSVCLFFMKLTKNSQWLISLIPHSRDGYRFFLGDRWFKITLNRSAVRQKQRRVKRKLQILHHLISFTGWSISFIT